jgi:hypothetical protein
VKKLIPLIAVLALVLAACGGGSDDGVASLETETTVAVDQAVDIDVDNEQALTDFAQCMRDNGIDMDDPTVDANGNLTFGGQSQQGNIEELDQDALQAAFDACEEHLAGVAMGFTDTDLSEIEDTLLEFTSCMREQGFDMADPDLSGGPGGVIDMFGDLDPSDPDVLEAAEECQEVFANLPFGGGTG